MEELEARRKKLHLGLMKLAREDLALVLQVPHDALALAPLAITSHTRCEAKRIRVLSRAPPPPRYLWHSVS